MFNSSVTLCILNSAMILSFNVSQTSSRCSSWQLENGLKTCESQRLPEDVVQSAGAASWVLKLPLVQTNQNWWQETNIGRSDNCAAAILGASQQRRARQLVGRRRQWDTCRRSRWRLPLPVIPHWDAGCRLLINRLTEKKQFVGWPAPDQWATWSAGIGQVMTLLRVKGAAVENTVMAEIEWSVLCQGLARFTRLQSGKLDHFSSPPSGGQCLACIPATSFPSTLAAT